MNRVKIVSSLSKSNISCPTLTTASRRSSVRKTNEILGEAEVMTMLMIIIQFYYSNSDKK